MKPDNRPRLQEATPPAPPSREITININLPKLKLPRRNFRKPALLRIPALPYTHLAVVTGVAVVILGGANFSYHAYRRAQVKQAEKAALSASGHGNVLTQPTFTPVAPKNKSQLGELGQIGTAFDGQHDTFSFKDTLNGTGFVVSQQPVPAKFSSTAQAVGAIAHSLNATQEVKNDAGPAFMAVDSKSGAQSLVATVKGHLIFIQSPFQHTAGEWKYYLESLQ